MYNGDPHPQPEKDLRNAVLNDLYNARTGRNFDTNALFCRYAINHGMGAPMGKAEIPDARQYPDRRDAVCLGCAVLQHSRRW